MPPARFVIASCGRARHTPSVVASPIVLHILAALVLCAAAMAAPGPDKVSVGYVVTGARMTAEDECRRCLAGGRIPGSMCRITYVTAGKWVPPACDVLWVHAPESGTL